MATMHWLLGFLSILHRGSGLSESTGFDQVITSIRDVPFGVINSYFFSNVQFKVKTYPSPLNDLG
jgi:hypothetical protein